MNNVPSYQTPPVDRASLERANRAMPPPEIPKKKVSWFLLVMALFAGLVVTGIVISMVRTASVPLPVIDAPETRSAAETAPRSPSEVQR